MEDTPLPAVPNIRVSEYDGKAHADSPPTPVSDIEDSEDLEINEEFHAPDHSIGPLARLDEERRRRLLQFSPLQRTKRFRSLRRHGTDGDCLNLDPDFFFIKAKPFTILLHGHQHKYPFTLFVASKPTLAEEIAIILATTFSTFKKNVAQRLLMLVSTPEIEKGPREEVRDISMKIRFLFRKGKGGHGIEKEIVAMEGNWESIMEALANGRGKRFVVDYAMREGT